jgi:RNA polymerase-binding transcription factor DksA
MKAPETKLISELRDIQNELMASLERSDGDETIRPFIQAELHDVNRTLEKLKNGNFGICEITGEPLPKDSLTMIPTMKSVSDLEKIKQFRCKTILS